MYVAYAARLSDRGALTGRRSIPPRDHLDTRRRVPVGTPTWFSIGADNPRR